MTGRMHLNIEPVSEGLKTIQHLVPVDMFFAASVTDGTGDVSNRLVLRLRGDEQFYFLFPAQEKRELNMKKPAPWLQKRLEQMAPSLDGPAAIPEDNVDVPVGSPA